VTAAEQAERLGYSRFWVAEHHGMGDHLAGTTPEVLLGRLAGATDSIRLGTGAVLLNHYSPYKVAEAFGTLDGLAPGRIDAGLGRANGSPASDRALGTDRRVENPDEDHEERIRAVVNHLYDAFPDDHPYADLTVLRSGAARRSVGARLQPGERGDRRQARRPVLFRCVHPTRVRRARFAAYREQFEPAELGDGPDEPYGMVAVNAVAGETDAAAARRRAPAEATFKRMQRGVVGTILLRRSRSRNSAAFPSRRPRRSIPTNGRERSPEPGDDRGTARTAR